jgi:hypothetical protein
VVLVVDGDGPLVEVTDDVEVLVGDELVVAGAFVAVVVGRAVVVVVGGLVVVVVGLLVVVEGRGETVVVVAADAADPATIVDASEPHMPRTAAVTTRTPRAETAVARWRGRRLEPPPRLPLTGIAPNLSAVVAIRRQTRQRGSLYPRSGVESRTSRQIKAPLRRVKRSADASKSACI